MSYNLLLDLPGYMQGGRPALRGQTFKTSVKLLAGPRMAAMLSVLNAV